MLQPATDGYNFQAHGNVELTPQERTNAFVVGNYKLTDSVETYLEFYHNKTQSASQLAPQPIDTLGSPLVISAQSYYNPFGVDFSNDGNRYKTRSVGNGNRINNFSTTVDQVSGRLQGHVRRHQLAVECVFQLRPLQPVEPHQSGYINLTKLGHGHRPVVSGRPATSFAVPIRRSGGTRSDRRLHAGQLLRRHAIRTRSRH